MSDRTSLILTTFEPRRRWTGQLASRYTLEVRVHHSAAIAIVMPLAEGWMRPTKFHVYELVDITPMPITDSR